MNKDMKYEDAVKELEALVAKIEDPANDLSAVSEEVKKAVALAKWCKNYIKEGEEKVERLLNGGTDEDI